MSKIDAAFAALDDQIPLRPHLVAKLVERYAHRKPFAGVTALLIQHQLGNSYCQAEALVDVGLDPEKIIWIDIPYTGIKSVRTALVEKLGLLKENLKVYPFEMLEPYAIRQRSRVNKAVRELLDNPPEKLLVLDDGSYFLESLMCFEKTFPAVAVVEQTTRGIIKLSKSAALQKVASQVPVINVAASAPKAYLEPPFIAKAVIRNLKEKFRKLKFSPENKKVLVLGYGNIGASVAKFLNRELLIPEEAIYINDISHEREAAAGDGFPLWSRKRADLTFDLVIGCTGQSSFCVDDFVYVNDGGLLVSCSSGAVEFSRRNFIELADLHEHDDIEILRDMIDANDIHADIPIRFPHRKITMLNGAWPINFVGDVNCIPTEYIQPTICMMVRAAIQAVEAMDGRRVGLIEFDPLYSEQLIIGFKKFLGEDAAILE